MSAFSPNLRTAMAHICAGFVTALDVGTVDDHGFRVRARIPVGGAP